MHRLISKITLILIIAGFVLSCSTGGEIKRAVFTIDDVILTKDVYSPDISRLASESISTFTADDKAVTAHVLYSNLYQEHNFRWEWMDPEGKLISATKLLSVRLYPFQSIIFQSF
jgi:hypothetical protein